MREKQFKNSPKGRSEIPRRAGEYMLLGKFGDVVNNDWQRTNNLSRRIKEEHYARHGEFSYIKIRYGKRYN
ncbi:hypothetical protein LCGC14_1468700, partial [marine sediment metagenome]